MSTLPRSATACPAGRFTRVPDAVLELDLSPRELQLVVVLLSYRWTPESEVRPSVRTLAGRLRCSERTVQRTVSALADRGLLAVEARYRGDDGQRPNAYHLDGALLAAMAPVDHHDVTRVSPTWRQGVTRATPERHSGNQTPGTRRPEARYSLPDPSAYLSGQHGRYIHR